MKLIIFLAFFSCSTVLSASDEVEAARLGAPLEISEEASISVWKNNKYVEVIKGTNEFTCLVWADHLGTYEPSCFNKEAMQAILPVYEFQRRSLAHGADIKEIHNQIKSKFEQGEFSYPNAGALVYMMHSNNKFFNHFEKKLIDVPPHIMLYYPRLKRESLKLNGKLGLPHFYSDYHHLSVIHVKTSAAR